ncbi:thioredoxin family protein [Nocardiopsis sp. CNT-189]|uniref:thioredoxin family protein n=1 Tax=Nocardiopsis oceanisediminis TaxID=2816862 RepID=UPI003B331610
MDAGLLYSTGCPSRYAAEERLAEAAAAAGLPLNAAARAVDTAEEAREPGFPGSPTFRAGGRGLFPGGTLSPVLSCRLYPAPEGPRGVPDTAAPARALGRHRG